MAQPLSLQSIIQQAPPKPPRILIYGSAGIGKTTFAAQALKPVFIMTEEGTGTRQVAHFPRARSFGRVLEALALLYSKPHDYRTVVIDSLDWLEQLILAKTCENNRWSSIEDPGYGKGYMVALNFWRQYLEGLDALRDDHQMTIVQIGHAEVRRFDSPEHDPYDRFQIKLHTKAAALMQEYTDVVLFANYQTITTSADVGFNKKTTRALGSGLRRMHTSERPAFIAKNRYDLPYELPLDWRAFADAMPAQLRPMLTDAPREPQPSAPHDAHEHFGVIDHSAHAAAHAGARSH